jgi:hypothetical protein
MKDNGYDHRDALFGAPPYGGSIAQQVYYADSNLCDANVDKRRGYPERSVKDGQMEPWQSPFILLVDRGDCTFVQKVRNAQRAGAAAVLIADNTCLCSDAVCIEQTSFDISLCEAAEPIMADDGSGADITIPSFLIFKQDADPIKTVLRQNQQVRVEMKFSIPASDPNSRVTYDLWTSPVDVVSRPFQRSFQNAAVALGAQFTPHMYVYDGVQAGCQGDRGEDECLNLCTNSGKYCTNDPDEDIVRGSSGADVVEESLRRLCVWKVYGTDGIGVQWWDYVKEYLKQCYGSVDNERINPTVPLAQCPVANVMKQSGVSEALVTKCMQDSGGLVGNVNNSIFDQQMHLKEIAGVFIMPSLYVNNAPVRGELSFSNAFRAICSGYASGYEPEICKTCANCHNEEYCVEAGICSAVGTVGVISTSLPSRVLLPLVVVSFIGLTTVLGYTVHQRQRLRMQVLRR